MEGTEGRPALAVPRGLETGIVHRSFVDAHPERGFQELCLRDVIAAHSGGGPVGFAWGALRILRYEVRCLPDGITAYEYAVESPLRLTHDASMATRVLELAREVPTLVWAETSWAPERCGRATR